MTQHFLLLVKSNGFHHWANWSAFFLWSIPTERTGTLLSRGKRCLSLFLFPTLTGKKDFKEVCERQACPVVHHKLLEPQGEPEWRLGREWDRGRALNHIWNWTGLIPGHFWNFSTTTFWKSTVTKMLWDPVKRKDEFDVVSLAGSC